MWNIVCLLLRELLELYLRSWIENEWLSYSQNIPSPTHPKLTICIIYSHSISSQNPKAYKKQRCLPYIKGQQSFYEVSDSTCLLLFALTDCLGPSSCGASSPHLTWDGQLRVQPHVWSHPCSDDTSSPSWTYTSSYHTTEKCFFPIKKIL